MPPPETLYCPCGQAIEVSYHDDSDPSYLIPVTHNGEWGFIGAKFCTSCGREIFRNTLVELGELE